MISQPPRISAILNVSWDSVFNPLLRVHIGHCANPQPVQFSVRAADLFNSNIRGITTP